MGAGWMHHSPQGWGRVTLGGQQQATWKTRRGQLTLTVELETIGTGSWNNKRFITEKLLAGRGVWSRDLGVRGHEL